MWHSNFQHAQHIGNDIFGGGAKGKARCAKRGLGVFYAAGVIKFVVLRSKVNGIARNARGVVIFGRCNNFIGEIGDKANQLALAGLR